MGIYINTNLNIRQLCDGFRLEKETFPNEFVHKNQERYFMFKYFFIENCVFYEITWKNVEDRETEHMII